MIKFKIKKLDHEIVSMHIGNYNRQNSPRFFMIFDDRN